MKIKVNNCCDCGLPCLFFCSLRDDSYEYVCDECGDDGQLYEWEGKELCIGCIANYLDKVN